jgi:polyisoprenoid-binding protein YceI
MGSSLKKTNHGSFRKFAGQIELVAEKPRPGIGRHRNDSIETEEVKLTTHLKSADFFEVIKFPKASFVLTEIKASGEKGATHTVTGNLEMHFVKKAIPFPATISVALSPSRCKSEFSNQP